MAPGKISDLEALKATELVTLGPRAGIRDDKRERLRRN